MNNNCKIHGFAITHLCCSSECLSFLCGKCVVEHLSSHKIKGSWPELFTIEELKIFCKNKLETIITNSSNIIKETEEKKKAEQAVQYKINDELIYLLKKKLLSLVEEYFINLTSFTHKECENLSNKLIKTLQNLKDIQIELENENENLENKQNLERLLLVFKTDYNKILSEYKNTFNDMLKEKFLISFKESKLDIFKRKFFDLANEVLLDNIESKNFPKSSHDLQKNISEIKENKENFTESSPIIEKRKVSAAQSEEKIKKSLEEVKQDSVHDLKTSIINDSKNDGRRPNSKTDIKSAKNSLKNESNLETRKEKNIEEINKKSLKNSNIEVGDNEEIRNYEGNLRKSINISPKKSLTNSTDFKKNMKSEDKINSNSVPERPEKPTSQNKIDIKSSVKSLSGKEEVKENVMENQEVGSSSSLKKSGIMNSFEITISDYFSPKQVPKYLHFFEENSKNLYILDLEKIEDPNTNFKKITLLIDFLVPGKSRSIITSEGLIFLIGGYYNKGNINCYLYDEVNQTLLAKPCMKNDRENFGITYLMNQIYVCGGNDEYGNKLSVCEKYDLLSNSWTKISSLNQKVSGLYICNFNDKFIFKFGGESTQTLLSQIIEIYDIKNNKWSVIQAFTDSNLVPVISRLGACIQLNEKNIFIFGGYYAKNDAGTNQSFILEVSEKKFTIKHLNEQLLPHCAGFWSNMPLIYANKVFCLQNVTDPDNKSLSLPDKRRVLCFNSKEWKKVK